MQKKILFLSLSLAGLVLLVMMFTPVPRAIPENCTVKRGVVAAISSPCCKDVAIQLRSDPKHYYINRGLDDGQLDLKELKAQILGKEVEFQVIKRNWTPLDPNHLLAPVAEIRSKGVVLFSRIKS